MISIFVFQCFRENEEEFVFPPRNIYIKKTTTMKKQVLLINCNHHLKFVCVMEKLLLLLLHSFLITVAKQALFYRLVKSVITFQLCISIDNSVWNKWKKKWYIVWNTISTKCANIVIITSKCFRCSSIEIESQTIDFRWKFLEYLCVIYLYTQSRFSRASL